jgi:predicted negative regulator of RcsB-dependent stress response
MAKHLDLEEQEQLDELKHFWNEYGNLITWALILCFGAIAAWNGWQYWQGTQATQAGALFEEVDRAAGSGDIARVERAFADIKDKFGGTAFAQQAGLLTAKVLTDRGNKDGAKAALQWVADKSSDKGYQAIARLRLASLLVDAKAYDDALKQLSAEFPKEFVALVADRRGDIFNLQGKKSEAKDEYSKAYKAFEERSEYRRLVEVKLTSLGVDAKSLAPVPQAPASGAARS